MAPPRRIKTAPSATVKIEPAGMTLAKFLVSEGRAKFLQGPVGSGKTTTVIESLMVNALMRQPVNAKGVRRRRTVVVRNTYL